MKAVTRFANAVEYCAVRILAWTVGISFVVRYLRNPNPAITRKLLIAFGAEVGPGTTLKRTLLLDNVCRDANSTGDFSHLKIGSNCYIGDCVFLDLADNIVIEDGAVVAGRASFITHSECNRSRFLSRRFPRMCAPIVLKQGSWIGFGATILAGVTVGENTAIGADALLLQDAEPYSVYVGSPARKLRSLVEQALQRIR